jgi:predicted transcriptional regulator
MKAKPTSYRLSDSAKALIERLARDEDRSRTKVIERAVRFYSEHQQQETRSKE